MEAKKKSKGPPGIMQQLIINAFTMHLLCIVCGCTLLSDLSTHSKYQVDDYAFPWINAGVDIVIAL